ncbi:MAG: hypothetical protein BWK78_03420 [Thiotrichaceae bacterium IS1]|nr:MAG: hypothetical protein BWK78_03420 [Thiotrichaceae bacterium IS1]
MKKLSFVRKMYQSTTGFLIVVFAVVVWAIPTQAQEIGYPSAWTDKVGDCIKVDRGTSKSLSLTNVENSFQVNDIVKHDGSRKECESQSLVIRVGEKDVFVDQRHQEQKLEAAPSVDSNGWKAFISAITSLFFQEVKAGSGGSEKGIPKCSLNSPQYLVNRGKIYIPSGGDGCPSSKSTQAQMSSCDKPPTSSPLLKLTGMDNKWLVLDVEMTTGQCYQLNVTGWTGKIEIMAVKSLDDPVLDTASDEDLKLEAYCRHNQAVNIK